MARHLLHREIVLPRPLAEVFPFFAEAQNLERITPPFMRFSILTPQPIAMRAGTVIDYRIALGGVPMRWRTLIESFEPGVQFVDVQLRGPYKLWRHTHRFFDEGGNTRMTDDVEYEVGFGPLGEVARWLFVGRTLERVFDYRSRVIGEQFGVTSTPTRSAA